MRAVVEALQNLLDTGAIERGRRVDAFADSGVFGMGKFPRPVDDRNDDDRDEKYDEHRPIDQREDALAFRLGARRVGIANLYFKVFVETHHVRDRKRFKRVLR